MITFEKYFSIYGELCQQYNWQKGEKMSKRNKQRFKDKHEEALFYRDMYWKFPLYRRAISLPKYVLGVSCYKRELRAYERYVDKFYLASSRCYPYFADTKLVTILDELPPGCENVINSPTAAPSEAAFPKPLTIFYVGGLGGHYKLDVLMAAVNVVPGIHLIVCCREKEWEKEKSSLEQYLSDRIAIIHKTSSELEPYYTSCDLCSALFANSAYMDMAMPYKLFEYLGNNKPVIATRDTAQGDFIEKTGAGWAIPCDLDATTELLRSLVQDPGKLLEKAELCTKAKLANTWEERAKKVIKDLL